jgi:hypothetical protein
MLADFLLPENVARTDGAGPDMDLGSQRGKPLVLTLGITAITEHQSLEVSLRGSSENGKSSLLATIPPKFYCGIYSILLDLESHPEVRSVRVQWKMGRWRKGDDAMPMCEFYVYAEEPGARVSASVVGKGLSAIDAVSVA